MGSNAWDRAQRAITRAEERDAAVVTPDNAVSPFDASATTVIPHADLPGRGGAPGPRGRHQRPEDATTDVHAPADDAPRSGRRRRPSPHPAPGAVDGAHADEPPTAPVDLSGDPAEPTSDAAPDPSEVSDDAPTENVATSPGAPIRLRTRARPDTSPFESPRAAGGHDGAAARPGGRPDPEVVDDADPPRRRGFWARLFGRR